MEQGIISKVYRKLQESLKMGYNTILYYSSYSDYELSNRDINDVFNSKLECVCFIDGTMASKLVGKGLVEFKKTKLGDCCCVLTDDNNLSEVLKFQTVLIIEGDLK